MVGTIFEAGSVPLRVPQAMHYSTVPVTRFTFSFTNWYHNGNYHKLGYVPIETQWIASDRRKTKKYMVTQQNKQARHLETFGIVLVYKIC